MPYIGLEEQGFYKPFEAVRTWVQDRRENKRRKAEDGRTEKEFELRQRLLNSQLSGLDFEQQQRKADADRVAGFKPSVRREGGYDLIETAPGKFEPRVAEKSFADQIAEFGLAGGGGPQTPPDGMASQLAPGTPSAPQQPGQLPQINGRQIRMGLSGGKPVPEFAPEERRVTVEQVPIPGGEPITAEVTREGDRIVNIQPVNLNRADTNKPLGDDALNKFNAASFAMAQLPDLTRAVESAGTSGGPVEGSVRPWLNWALGQNPTDLEFGNLSARTLAPIAKGVLGETGVLSDQDIARITPLLPQYTDTQANRQIKLQKLKEVLTSQASRWLQIMKAAGRKTDNLQSLMAPMIAEANGGPAPAGSAGQPVTVNSQAEYDALAPGTRYTDASGKTKVKQ